MADAFKSEAHAAVDVIAEHTEGGYRKLAELLRPLVKDARDHARANSEADADAGSRLGVLLKDESAGGRDYRRTPNVVLPDD